MSKRIPLAIMLSVAMLSLAACGSAPSLPTAGSVSDANADPDNQSTYRIGPGDTLQVFVWRNPEISTTVPVRPDGKISTPLVEDMLAVGKTPSELARDMEGVLAEYIRAPSVNIIVSGFQGVPEEQIRVVGQAANPQTVPYREGVTLLDVMIQVGGLGEFAAGNRARIVRRVNGEMTEYRVKLEDLLNKGKVSENVAMEPGDVLIIPEAYF